MPNIKSQKKRMRQAEKRTLRNRAEKTRLKTFISYFEEALEKKEVEKAEEFFCLASKYLDKAVSKGIIHKNRAADKKSRLAQKLALLKKELPKEEKKVEEKKEEATEEKKKIGKRSQGEKKTLLKTVRKKAPSEKKEAKK